MTTHGLSDDALLSLRSERIKRKVSKPSIAVDKEEVVMASQWRRCKGAFTYDVCKGFGPHLPCHSHIHATYQYPVGLRYPFTADILFELVLLLPLLDASIMPLTE